MLGYKFEIEENCNNFLNVLLSNIDLNEYYVLVKEDETLPRDSISLDCNSLFSKSIYKYPDFYDELKNRKYYPIFMRLDFSKTPIDDGERLSSLECLQSNIDLIILVTDSIYGEVYCKDKKLLARIFLNLKNSKNFKKIGVADIRKRKTISSYTD